MNAWVSNKKPGYNAHLQCAAKITSTQLNTILHCKKVTEIVFFLLLTKKFLGFKCTNKWYLQRRDAYLMM